MEQQDTIAPTLALRKHFRVQDTPKATQESRKMPCGPPALECVPHGMFAVDDRNKILTVSRKT